MRGIARRGEGYAASDTLKAIGIEGFEVSWRRKSIKKTTGEI